MSSKVLIGNLPPGTTADEVVELFSAEKSKFEPGGRGFESLRARQ
jgi:hypothetical protein